MQKLHIKKLSHEATLPVRANQFAAGMDLFAIQDDILPPSERRLFKTGIAMEIPPGHYGRIADRSGNAYKKGLHVMAGIIDEDYRGELGVILFNTDRNKAASIQKGDRIAQLIIEKYYAPPIEEVSFLEETDRGTAGFGSTGN